MHQQILEAVNKVAVDRHRLVIVCGEFGSGKTELLKDIAVEANGVYLNLNLSLSDILLSTPRNQYADGITVPNLIDSICDEASSDGRTLFVDNIEILFSPETGRINPIDTFKRIAKKRVVVLAIPARRLGSSLVYSQLGREDYMSMLQELLGHKDVKTTMIYTHVLKRGPKARSPVNGRC